MCTIYLICLPEGRQFTPRTWSQISAALASRTVTASYYPHETNEAQPVELTGVTSSCYRIPAADNLDSKPHSEDFFYTFIQQIGEQHAGQTVTVFAHRMLIGALLCHLLDLPSAHVTRIQLQAGAISKIIIEPHRVVVAGTNDCCHLRV